MLNTTRPEASFGAQFGSARSVASAFGPVGYVDLDPGNSSGLPLLVLTGWAVGRQSCRDLAWWLYCRGRRLLLIDFTALARHPGPDPRLETVSKTAATIAVIDRVGVGLVDVLAHSQGALVAVDLAKAKPDLVDGLVLAMPSGMIGPDSAWSFGIRFGFGHSLTLLRDLRTNRAITARIIRDACCHLCFNPARAWRELRAVGQTTIDRDLIRLRQSINRRTGQRLRVGVLGAVGDHLTPRRRLERRVRPKGRQRNVDSYVCLGTRWAGHNDLLVKPDRSGAAAEQLFAGFARLDDKT